MTLQTYGKWQPTTFDRRGAFLQDDRSDWLVVPVIRQRDSGPFEQSNFQCALDTLEAEAPGEYELHRFGHWACGWFEVLIVKPDSWAQAAAEALERCLENYPLLNEDDYSEREYTAAQESWKNTSLRERIRLCAKYDLSIFAARLDYIPEDDSGALFDYLRPEN